MPKRIPPTLDEAEAEFIRVCAEISRLEKRAVGLEKRIISLRKRAEKVVHYIEIARDGVGAQGRSRRPRQPKLRVVTTE
jgi:hypothetical protein